MSHDPETEDAPIKGTGPIYEGPLSAARIDAQIRHVFRKMGGGYMVGIDPAIGKDKLVLKLVAMPPATEPTDAELEDLGDVLQLAWERGLHWRWCATAAYHWFRDTGRLSPAAPVPVPLPTQTPAALSDEDRGYKAGFQAARSMANRPLVAPVPVPPTDADVLAVTRIIYDTQPSLDTLPWHRDAARAIVAVYGALPVPPEAVEPVPAPVLWLTDEAAVRALTVYWGEHPNDREIENYMPKMRDALRAAGAVEPPKATRPVVTRRALAAAANAWGEYPRPPGYGSQMHAALNAAFDVMFPAAPATGTEGGGK